MIARVINLEPSGERWDGFTASAQAAGMAYTRFPAVDTRTITPESLEAKQVRLMPRKLMISGDGLYMHRRGERIKFVDRALLKISRIIEFELEAEKRWTFSAQPP